MGVEKEEELSADEIVRQVHLVGASVTEHIEANHGDVPIGLCVVALLDAARNLVQVTSEIGGTPVTEVAALEVLEQIVANMRVSQQTGQVLVIPIRV